jgi:hypothetical protein
VNGRKEQQLRIRWSEKDGPAVVTPKRTGFGHTVVKDMFARMLDAHVQMDFHSEGMSWTAEVPMTSLAGETEPKRV